MSEQPGNEKEQAQSSHTPAPAVKRVLAWVGIIYMVALVLLNIYPFFTQGGSPLLRAGMVILAAACLVVMVLGAVDGIPALISGLGGGRG